MAQEPNASTREEKTLTTRSRQRHFSGLIAGFGVLLAVIAILISFFVWKRIQMLDAQLLAVTGQSQQSNQTQSQTINQLAGLKNTIQQQQQLIHENQQAISQLMQTMSMNKNNWLVSDAAQLLKMASMTLYFEHNVSTTIILLKSADQRLYEADDSALYSARQIIHNDIAALQSLPKVDSAGIYMQLTALRNQTLSLPLAANRYENDSIDNQLSQVTTATNSWWGKVMTNTSHALGKVIIIRRRPSAIQPLLSAKQDVVLSQNIYLLYSQAQWAVLHQKSSVYQQSLNELITSINQYYVPSAQTASILMALQQLSKQTILAKYPNIRNALKAIYQYQKAEQKGKL